MYTTPETDGMTDRNQRRAALRLRDQYLEGLAALMLTPGLDRNGKQRRADLLIEDMIQQIQRLAPDLCDVCPRSSNPTTEGPALR